MSTKNISSPGISIQTAFRGFVSKLLAKSAKFEFKVDPHKGVHFVDTTVNAMREGKNILVWGDKDIDGMTSTTYKIDMLSDVAEFMGFEEHTLDFHIPSRYDNYGLSYAQFKHKLEEYDLIITSDNGTHREFFDKLTKEDMDKLLIVDHHPNGDFSKYKNVINPNTEGNIKISTGLLDEYLFQVFRKRYKQYGEAREEDHFRDLAAISLLADRADRNNPLVRRTIETGLKRVSQRERAIYRSLFPVFYGDTDTDITPEDIDFGFSPKFNSSGRLLTELNILVKILLNKKGGKIFDERVRDLIYVDLLRKDATNAYTQSALVIAKEQLKKNPNANLLIIYQPNAPIGINGLIAGNIQQQLMVDTFSLSDNIMGDNRVTGSGRGENIKGHYLEMLQQFPELKEVFRGGGHFAAMGVTTDDIAMLIEKTEAYNRKVSPASEIKKEHALFNKEAISIEDYRLLCEEYYKIVNDLPLDRKIMAKLKVYITGPTAMRNSFRKITIKDNNGDSQTIIAKENEEMEYNGLNPIDIAVEIKPIKELSSHEDAFFAEITPHNMIKPDNDIMVKLPLEIMTQRTP